MTKFAVIRNDIGLICGVVEANAFFDAPYLLDQEIDSSVHQADYLPTGNGSHAHYSVYDVSAIEIPRGGRTHALIESQPLAGRVYRRDWL